MDIYSTCVLHWIAHLPTCCCSLCLNCCCLRWLSFRWACFTWRCGWSWRPGSSLGRLMKQVKNHKYLKVHVQFFSCAVFLLYFEAYDPNWAISTFERNGSSGFHTHRKNVYNSSVPQKTVWNLGLVTNTFVGISNFFIHTIYVKHTGGLKLYGNQESIH